MRVTLICGVLILGIYASGSTDVRSGEAVDEYALKNRNYFTGKDQVGNAVITYSRNTSKGKTQQRPLADGRCCSRFGPVRYQAQAFTVGNAGTYDLVSDQDGWDGVLFLYKVSFNPQEPQKNLLVGDDDGEIGIGTSAIYGMALEPGTTYVAVTTGFGNGDEGSFTNTIDGEGPIMLVSGFAPTLGRWSLLILVLALTFTGLGVMRLKRMG